MKEIQSLQNSIIKEVLKLQNKKDRNIANKFLVEGYHLINEAYQLGLLESVFSVNINDEVKYKVNNFYLVNDIIIKKLSSTVNPQGIVGVVKKAEFKDLDLNKEKIKIILLDDINDPGNLGSIIRTAAALGYDAIYMSKETVDIYNDKTIRATQGTIFKIPCFYTDLEEMVIKLKKHNIKCFGTTLDANTDIEEVENLKKYAICFGNEARGMSEKIKSIMNANVKINMENNVESLNVLSASSIIMYEFGKRVI